MPPSPDKWPNQPDAMAVDGDTSGGKGAGRRSALRRTGERGESAAKIARVGSELAVASDSNVEVSPSTVDALASAASVVSGKRMCLSFQGIIILFLLNCLIQHLMHV